MSIQRNGFIDCKINNISACNSNKFEKDYRSSLSAKKMDAKLTKYILCGAGAGALVGAGTGAVISQCSAGTITIPSVVIGSVVGASVGTIGALSIHAIWKCKDYKTYSRKSSDKEISDTVQDLLNKCTMNEFICPITGELALDPVVTPYTSQKYERHELEKWIKKHGTDPETRQPMTIDDIYNSPRGLGGTVNVIEHKLNEQIKNPTMSKRQIEVLIKMRDIVNERKNIFFEVEIKNLMREKKEKKIDFMEFARRVNLFADVQLAPDVKKSLDEMEDSDIESDDI